MKTCIPGKRCVVFFGIGLGLIIVLILASGMKRAKASTTFTVMNTADSGPGSLRQAIINANTNTGADAINFQAGLTGTITLTSGQLPAITENLTIIGPGALVITVSGNHASGIFEIASGVIVTISDLTISNAFHFAGGGILNNGGTLSVSNSTLSDSSSSAGGGIANLGGGSVTVINSTFSGNTASGGGIFNQGGMVTITNSTISNNSAAGGGGVFNQGGTVTITDSTISNNSATVGGFAMGGAIFIDSGTVNIANSTLSGNLAINGGGGIRVTGGTVNIKNSIVANSTGGDCSVADPGILNALGVNFSTDGTCPGLTQVTAGQLNLGPLQDNGGPTKTHALLSGSVAIDAVTDCTDVAGNSITQDQRGVLRPIDGNCDEIAACDVGAYEAPVCTTSTFNVCLQDDSNASIVFLGNTQTGAYLFCCGGTVLTGIAQVIVRGSTATFQHYSADRRVLARADGGVFRGTAALQSSPGTTICTITDRDTRNNSCVCQ